MKTFFRFMALPVVAVSFFSYAVLSDADKTRTPQELADVLEESSNEARMIKCELTVYCEKECDQDAWRAILDGTADCLRSLGTEDRATLVKKVGNILKAACEKGGDVSGIHGDLTIKVGDGICDCCQDICDCTKRYKGLCPCSMDDAGCRCSKK